MQWDVDATSQVATALYPILYGRSIQTGRGASGKESEAMLEEESQLGHCVPSF